MAKRIYLDAAAATPVDKRVIAEMLPFLNEQFHNPSALYQEAREVRAVYEQARSRVARCLGAKPSEIIFTAGGSESTNLAIHGVMQRFPQARLVLSAVEHEAVQIPAKHYTYDVITVDEQGIVILDELDKLIAEDTVLVSVMLANNEVGSIQPIAEIARMVQKHRENRESRGVRLPLLFHVDACQAPLYLDVQVRKLGADLLTLNGGKIHGPKQSGILYVRAGVVLQPQIEGGGQEFGIRSGTENVAQAVGFAKALELAEQGRAERAKKISLVRDYFIKQLEEQCGAELNGHRTRRLAHNVHVTFAGKDNERILFALDDAGVAAAAGSACSASKDTSSHVLLAMGKSDADARSSVRFSLLQSSTESDVDIAMRHIVSALTA